MLFNGPKKTKHTIVLAHGAGAAMDTPFMEFFSTGLGDKGFRVARFEFPYMANRRTSGKGGPPDREPVLRQTWLKVIEELGRDRLIIGGKSMGGRIASMVADEAKVAGLICLGYPFHPVGKPDKLRVAHLQSLTTSTLILQGERDTFGTKEDVAGYSLSHAIEVHWLRDGDHSFKPRKSSGATEQANLQDALDAIIQFVG